MNLVEPIRDLNKIEEMKKVLLEQGKGKRNYLIFKVGINSGLRVSDLIKLKVSDIKFENGIMRDDITIMEKKTNKKKVFRFNAELKNELDNYTKNMKQYEYVFKSRKGINQPLTRTQVYRFLNDAAKIVGITDNIGTHTMRKTFGFHNYKKYADIAMLQTVFNHSSPGITLRYIGISQDEINNMYDDFCL